MKYFFLLLFSFCAAMSLAQNDSTRNEFEFLEYGLVFNHNYYLARNQVSKDWGITYKRVANCMVSTAQEDSVRTYNNKVSKALENKFGKDWEERYNAELDFLLDSLDTKDAQEKERQRLLNTREMALQTKQPIAAMELAGANVLFRGYANKIYPASTRFDSITLYSADCSISRPNGASYFVVKPGRSKIADVTLCVVKNDSLIPIKTVSYRVVNLPDPQVYWGANLSGNFVDKNDFSLSVKYDEIYPLEGHFEIVEWSFVLKEKTYSGKGMRLDAVKHVFDAMEIGDSVVITVKVRGEDGIVRQMTGIWDFY